MDNAINDNESWKSELTLTAFCSIFLVSHCDYYYLCICVFYSLRLIVFHHTCLSHDKQK